MNKMLRNIIIMAVVVAIAIVAFIFIPKLEPKADEGDLVSAEPTTDPAELIINDKTIEDVAKVTLENDGVITVVVYDETSEEYILEGYEDYDIDQTTAGNIFYTSSFVSVEEMVTEDLSNLTQFGLEEPVSKVTTEYKDGTTDVFIYGDTVPGSGQHYIMKEGIDKIFIVWNNYGNNAKLKLKDILYVQKHEFQLAELDVLRILKDGEVYMEFQDKQGEDNIELSAWKLTKPYYRSINPADQGSFYSMTEEVLSVTPNKVLDAGGSAGEYGLDNPWLQIDLVPKVKDGVSILFGDEIDGIYPMMYSDSDIIYEVPVRETSFLKYKTIDVVERLLMLVDIKYVSSIELSGVLSDNTVNVTVENQVDKEGNIKLNDDGEPKTYINYIVDGVDLTEDERDQGSWFYQSILGIQIMNELEDGFIPQVLAGSVRLGLNKEPHEFVVEFYEYNDYFYAVKFNDNETYLVVKIEDVLVVREKFELLQKRELTKPY